jgi:hypothetical protein
LICENSGIEAPMLSSLYVVTVLFCAAGGCPHRVAASAAGTFVQQVQDPRPSPAEQKPSDAAPQPAAVPAATPASPTSPTVPAAPASPVTPATQAKPAEKPKKVITNDDLKNPGSGDGSGFSPMEFSEVNDCDRNCFENVRQMARVPTGANPNWKRDLLQAIDKVRKDDEWQKYLRELYDVHLRFCQLGDEKKDELNKYADPRNVTPREIAIDDKYDAKFKEVQTSLQTLYYRQGDLQRRFGANPYAYQFSMVQTSRIQNASCAAQRYPKYAPSDADDP